MKHIVAIIFILIFASFVVKGEDSVYRAIYEMEEIFSYREDSLDFKIRNDILRLELYPNKSFCYSKYSWETDSLLKQPNGKKVWMQIFHASYKEGYSGEPAYPHFRNTFQIYKDHRNNSQTVFDFFDGQYYKYEEVCNKSHWNVTDSIKNINGYSCIKAEGNLYGRNWTVWFCPDLPWSDGPWKLCGLPGLIVQAYDNLGFYKFQMKCIYSIDTPITFWAKNAKKTTRIEFNQQRYNYWQKLEANLKAEFGINSKSSRSSSKRYRIGLESDYPHK